MCYNIVLKVIRRNLTGCALIGVNPLPPLYIYSYPIGIPLFETRLTSPFGQ